LNWEISNKKNMASTENDTNTNVDTTANVSKPTTDITIEIDTTQIESRELERNECGCQNGKTVKKIKRFWFLILSVTVAIVGLILLLVHDGQYSPDNTLRTLYILILVLGICLTVGALLCQCFCHCT
jgi:hypothetical protein